VFHFVTPRGRRVPSPGSALRATVLMLLAVIGCCIAACGGGSSTTASSPTAQAAQKQAAAVAQRRAAALRRKRAAALRKRRARARRIRAERRVRAAAKRRREEVARRAAAQRAASDGCPGGLVPEGTEACVLPGGQSAGCGDDPYSTPTRSGGCIGPAHPPSTGPATNCPPGEVPAGETGACAPAAAGYGDPPASSAAVEYPRPRSDERIASRRWVGYANCAPNGPPAHTCYEGDLPMAVFKDRHHDDTMYRVCFGRVGSARRCKSRRTHHRSTPSAVHLPTSGIGSYQIRWFWHGRVVAEWTYNMQGEGV
jgi:hypothetical protein